MIAMQYKILLSDDYDMDNIRQRVKNNGYKTDGFQDLMFKAYLIKVKITHPKAITNTLLCIYGKTVTE